MKKRILSIILTICMVAAMAPVMSTTASAADTCTCLIQCTDSYRDEDCPVCKSGGTGGACLGRNLWGKFFDTTGLQHAMDLSATYPTIYFQVDDKELGDYHGVVELNQPITVPKNANAVIDLNGRTISGEGKYPIFLVQGKLTIIDTKGGGKLTNGGIGAVHIYNGGHLLMQGGSIEGNSENGVLVYDGGTFEMTGGTLTENFTKSTWSAELYVTNINVSANGKFIIDGDAHIFNDWEGGEYDGCFAIHFEKRSDDDGNVFTSTVYADGGVIDGALQNMGFITSTRSGEWSTITGKIANSGTIAAGKYTGEVINGEEGTISDGSFECKVTNNGLVNGGTFDAEVDNQDGGIISGGVFAENGVVKNAGTITGGTFLGTVETTENGTIEDSAKVSVHFVNEAGETMKTLRVLRGQGISAEDLSTLIDTTQYGYNIARYYIGDEEYKGGGHFTEDETYVTVKLFSPKKYTITCVLNNGQKDWTYNYTVTDPDFTLYNPTKDGYVFVGWSRTDVQEVYNTALTVTIPQGSIGDRTYTAVYMKDWSGEVMPWGGYSIVFDTQGGSPIASKTELTKSDKVLEGVKEPTKAGYSFFAWYCGGNPVVLVDTTVEDLKDKADKGVITLTAKWREKVTVSFNTAVQEYTYDGTEKAFEIKDTNIANLDGFNVTYRQNGSAVETPTDVGAYDVIITREEDDNCKAVNETIKNGLVIKPKAVTATISEISDQTYTGKEIEPAITVSVGTDEIPASEYTVAYADNRNAGTATVTVTDKAGGNYTFAQISRTFTINKKSITPAVAMADYVYGTVPDYPEVSGNEGGGVVSIYYSTHDDIATKPEHREPWDVADIDGTTLNAGTYYMMVTVAESRNCTAGTSPVITFKVAPDKYAAPAVPALNGSAVTIDEADRDKGLEYSLNGGGWTDVPALDNGSFVLPGLAENTGCTLSLRVKASADGNYAASDAVGCFSVAYNANGGTGTVSCASAGSGNAVTAASGDQLQRDGYTFAGWNTEADGSGTTYAAGAAITTAATLYAQWTANSSGGGSGSGSSGGSSGSGSSGGSYTPTYPPTVEQPEEGGSVTTSTGNPTAGDKVTITPKADEGYEVDEILVTDQNGNPVEITDNGDGTYSFTQPSGKVTIRVVFGDAAAIPLVDVPAHAYYYDAVLWAAENGITDGVDETHFAPDATCTRAQIVTFLWRAAGCPEPENLSSFADVPADSYYAKAVAWAVEQGITVGTGDGKFSPDAPCTRAQYVTFLWRAQGAPDANASNPFIDVAEGTFYTDAVLWAAENGITLGTNADGTTFSPDGDCTRAQIVTFLYRCLGQ